MRGTRAGILPAVILNPDADTISASAGGSALPSSHPSGIAWRKLVTISKTKAAWKQARAAGCSTTGCRLFVLERAPVAPTRTISRVIAGARYGSQVGEPAHPHVLRHGPAGHVRSYSSMPIWRDPCQPAKRRRVREKCCYLLIMSIRSFGGHATEAQASCSAALRDARPAISSNA